MNEKLAIEATKKPEKQSAEGMEKNEEMAEPTDDEEIL